MFRFVIKVGEVPFLYGLLLELFQKLVRYEKRKLDGDIFEIKRFFPRVVIAKEFKTAYK
jgi:hypothetical protein